MFGGVSTCAKSKLTIKTLNRKNDTALRGCRLSTGEVFTSPKGGVKITLQTNETADVLTARRTEPTVMSFKCRLKTLLFSEAFETVV